mmetsp:Transcript_11550/g.43347  ORF Transcript_11550/g.43347 Transcript_11550/m.43347 type:complete len:203 (-) Transcript_11550:3141-3749(-)
MSASSTFCSLKPSCILTLWHREENKRHRWRLLMMHSRMFSLKRFVTLSINNLRTRPLPNRAAKRRSRNWNRRLKFLRIRLSPTQDVPLRHSGSRQMSLIKLLRNFERCPVEQKMVRRQTSLPMTCISKSRNCWKEAQSCRNHPDSKVNSKNTKRRVSPGSPCSTSKVSMEFWPTKWAWEKLCKLLLSWATWHSTRISGVHLW